MARTATVGVRCLVIGTGALGSASAYWLSKRLGHDVVVLEQFAPGHTRGASEDHSRIIRHSYQHPAYTRLTRAMFDAWAQVEEEAAMRLVVHCGGLDLAEPGVAGSMTEVDDCARAMEAVGTPFERLDGAEIMRRWPQWTLPDGAVGLFQAESGLLDIRQACAALLTLATAQGASILSGVRVQRLEPREDEVLVHTDDAIYAAQDVVVCAGKWTNRVIEGVGRLPVRLVREQVTYFRSPRLRDFSPERFPVWIRWGDPCFYGFPVYGTAATKAAEDLGGPEVELDDEESPVDPARITRVRDFLAARLPGALGPVSHSRSCVYDLTPDREFIVDRLPGAPRVQVAVTAGHGGKFAALIGRVFADRVVDGTSEHDVSAFRIDRPGVGLVA